MSAIVYLNPDASDSDIAAAADIVTELAGSEPEILSNQEAYEEYVRLFEDESPDLVEAVVPEALPVSLRFTTDDQEVVASVEARLRAEELPLYRIVDSATGTQIAVRSIKLLGVDALDALQDQDDDPEAASAADELADVELADVEPDSDVLSEPMLLLADRAEACGLLD